MPLSNHIRCHTVLVIWFISIILGCVLYLAIWAPVTLYKKLVLTPSWEPIRFLRKLERQGRLRLREPGLRLDRAKVELNGKPFELFLLEPNVKNREEVWVGPPITITWEKEDAKLSPEEKQLKGQIHEHLKAPGAPGPLAESLKQGKTNGILKVEWERSNGEPGPHLVGKDKVKDWFIRQDIIVVEK